MDTNGLSHINIITLPPNVTFIFQPMDQVIIAWIKKLYKYELVVDLIEIYTDPDLVDGEVASIKSGIYDGVAQGVCPCLHNAIVILSRIWDAMPSESVTKCWKKAECMPVDDSENDDNGGTDD